MKAQQVLTLGPPPDCLQRTEIDIPEPGPGQLLLKVRTAALNFPDVLMVQGLYQERPPLPFTPGVECCGDVVGVGPAATAGSAPAAIPAVGTRVMGTTVMPHGALAEYALAEAALVAPAPAALDDAAAAAFTIAYQTGWVALHRRARLQPGETLLVHAAAGGVGSAAVQLGKAAGARVVAVVGGAEKAAVATASGADVVIDRTEFADLEGLTGALREACGRAGADVVYDPVGGDAFTASTKVIAFEGRILIVGFTSGKIPQAATNHALVKNYGVLGVYWGLYRSKAPQVVRQAQRELNRLVEAGKLAPVVSQRLSFDEAGAGLAALGSGRTTGRVVVELHR